MELQSEGTAVRHIGPMAQDFQHAFAVGADDKHIAVLDADGVALAAIQALYAMVRDRDRRLAALGRETTLRLAKMEARHRDEMRALSARLEITRTEQAPTRTTLATQKLVH